MVKCPRCGSQLVNMGIRRVGRKLGKLVLYCPNCKITYEIEIEFEDEEVAEEILAEDLEKYRLGSDALPEDAPRALKIIVGLRRRSFIPIYYRVLKAEPPEYGRDVSPGSLEALEIPQDIASSLARYWLEKGIKKLYKFQEEAFRKISEGKNVIITAPTGMGKTEAFLIPSLLRVIREGLQPPAVLVIYPTKALARDQFLKIRDYCEIFKLRVGVLDGDTPPSERRRILIHPPHVLLTNFDMMHYHLARRTTIGTLFAKARIVIIDEAHEYVGAFGTHVHYILKRLRRRAGHAMQFIMASATVRNPKEFAEVLISEPVEIISESRRKTPLHILFIYSLDAVQRTAALLALETIRRKIKSLIFFNTRRSAELALHILMKLSNKYPEVAGKFDLHRAGLPRKVRAEIESEFRSGEKLALFATPTLELGIDIGDVDLVISEITPIDRFIQRSGRAGRRGNPGSAILLLRDDDPISDYYAQHPNDYFEDVSVKYIEPRNLYISRMHTYLAAYEAPLDIEEIESGMFPKEAVKALLSEGALVKLGRRFYANGLMFNQIFSSNIRGSDKVVKVIYNGKEIDEREVHIAIRELHPGAIYINRGVKYIVKKLDLNALRAEVEKAPKEYQDLFTRPMYSSGARFVSDITVRDAFGTKLFFGKMLMHEIVEGYAVFREGERKPLAIYPLDEPIHYEYETFGLAFKAPEARYNDEEKVGGAYHALEHVIIEGTNAVTGGGSEDLGGISFSPIGIIVIHDAIPGGNGVSHILFTRFEKAVERAYKILESCRCSGDLEHCNKCVYSYRCGNNNRPLYQKGAMELLKRLLSGERVEGAERVPEVLEVLEKGLV